MIFKVNHRGHVLQAYGMNITVLLNNNLLFFKGYFRLQLFDQQENYI